MSRRVLDTNRLISFWRKQRSRPLDEIAEEEAKSWGKKLIEIEGTSAILTPIRVEFLCGVTSSHELRLSRAFLSCFKVVDGGRITSEDWTNAERYASWVRRDGRPRHFGDCLIEAIVRRLGYDIDTDDVDLGRRSRFNDPGHPR